MVDPDPQANGRPAAQPPLTLTQAVNNLNSVENQTGMHFEAANGAVTAKISGAAFSNITKAGANGANLDIGHLLGNRFEVKPVESNTGKAASVFGHIVAGREGGAQAGAQVAPNHVVTSRGLTQADTDLFVTNAAAIGAAAKGQYADASKAYSDAHPPVGADVEKVATIAQLKSNLKFGIEGGAIVAHLDKEQTDNLAKVFDKDHGGLDQTAVFGQSDKIRFVPPSKPGENGKVVVTGSLSAQDIADFNHNSKVVNAALGTGDVDTVKAMKQLADGHAAVQEPEGVTVQRNLPQVAMDAAKKAGGISFG